MQQLSTTTSRQAKKVLNVNNSNGGQQIIKLIALFWCFSFHLQLLLLLRFISFLNGPIPALFLFIFTFFKQTNNKKFTTNSNLRPSDRESRHITSRPGLWNYVFEVHRTYNKLAKKLSFVEMTQNEEWCGS